LTYTQEVPPAPQYYDLDQTTAYDASGNVSMTYGWEKKYISGQWTVVHDETRSYYTADEKLGAFNRHTGRGSVSAAGGVFEQYRYDALGRRVFVRSRSTTTCGAGACGYVERTVWDGAQVLYEIRAPGGDATHTAYMELDGTTGSGVDSLAFGVVGYTHAGGIDQPVAIHRHNLSIGTLTLVPHANWQGDFAFGTKADGSTCATSCWNIPWPGGRASADGEVMLAEAVGTGVEMRLAARGSRGRSRTLRLD
jgi:hypothetical protein